MRRTVAAAGHATIFNRLPLTRELPSKCEAEGENKTHRFRGAFYHLFQNFLSRVRNCTACRMWEARIISLFSISAIVRETLSILS